MNIGDSVAVSYQIGVEYSFAKRGRSFVEERGPWPEDWREGYKPSVARRLLDSLRRGTAVADCVR